MNKKLMISILLNVIGAVAYVFLVSQLLTNGHALFNSADNNFIEPFAFLLLFVLSAAIVGMLLFGQAIFLFFDNKKKDSILSAVYSVGWLFVITVILIIGLIIF